MIIDSHVHFGPVNDEADLGVLGAKMLDEMDANGIGRFCIAVSGLYPGAGQVDSLATALWLKLRNPQRVYVFGGLDWTGIAESGVPETPLTDQLEMLRSLGCDGVKLLTGKPDRRKALGHALDSDVFEPLYTWLERESVPCLWHIADPAEFWNPDTTPEWARRNGWWYDATHPSKAQIDAEAMSVFRRHPGLRLSLAHFFFASDRLPAARQLLADFPEIRLDLAPGVEMLHNFTRSPDEARAFFVEHADRILYGTDTGMSAHSTGSKRGWMVRHWLGTNDTFDVPDDPFMLPDERPALRGIGLPADVLQQLFADNFGTFVGADCPCPLAREAVAAFCRNRIATARDRGVNCPSAAALLPELA